MYYVGLDYHLRKSVFQVLDENGKKIMSRTVRGSAGDLIAEISKIQRPFSVCFEASSSYGYLHDALSEIASRVVAAHPGRLRLIFCSKHKNDSIDAERLAKLLFLDEVPPAYVPHADIRAWRSMIEHRHRLVEENTRVKNALKALFRSQCISTPCSLWTKQGLSWVERADFQQPFDVVRRDDLLMRLETISRMIRRVEKELNNIGQKHPGVVTLMTIPGVGIRTAEAVVAYIDNPHRFRHNKSIGNYFGLIPAEYSSADRTKLGHITRQGPSTVRRLLVEAAWQAVRRSVMVRKFFERISKNDKQRRKTAIVATAHYLLRVMHAMLRTGECWKEMAV